MTTAELQRLNEAQEPEELPPASFAGPLVRQPEPAARLAHILHRAAQDLWDVCTLHDHAQMYEEARAIASRVLAACPLD
jgi:hypothetical protein